ncbi:MAG: response regulator [Anaerolineae bacterium]
MTTDVQGQILVVDDNRTNRLKLSRSLELQGHAVTLAADGRQALDLLRAQPFDVVLLDIVMPGLDGYQVLERIKADPALRDIPVIVISALDEMDSVVRCIEMGAIDYLPKPFNPVLLQARLKASLQEKKLRDLEKAYLQQEVMLRQSEKLATLGKLSAGLAHEMNNPAAATRRSAAQLSASIAALQRSHLRLGQLSLDEAQMALLLSLDGRARQRATEPAGLDPITRSDREEALEAWLHTEGIEAAWEAAPALAELDYGPQALERLVASFDSVQLAAVIGWLNETYTVYSLLEEIGQGAGRLSELVQALKGYTYLDQAPIQMVDLHHGLDSTLVILRSKLRPGITVRREYADDMPPVPAYGSELNQVWTNLIDNAIDAMDGQGKIELHTRHDDEWAIVEIEDNGPGIPEEVLPHLFEPFYTTKPPGSGMGLGLNISHNIVVQKHRGRIEVTSEPGRTCFEVRIPINGRPGE